MTADLAPSRLLLIHGGASGIGTHGIQVARALGARVAVTAGAQNKLDLCTELGAEITINYRDEDFVERVRGEAGADVILDIMGAKYLDRNVDALATGGRLVIIGMQGGVKAELNIGKLLAKLDELKLSGHTLVLFTSDHGYMIGQHRLHTKGNAAWVGSATQGPKRPNMFEYSRPVNMKRLL